eukprot:scaffold76_cov363-Pavlova_lutheri.AAC.3
MDPFLPWDPMQDPPSIPSDFTPWNQVPSLSNGCLDPGSILGFSHWGDPSKTYQGRGERSPGHVSPSVTWTGRPQGQFERTQVRTSRIGEGDQGLDVGARVEEETWNIQQPVREEESKVGAST